jgi:hypothetical protein
MSTEIEEKGKSPMPKRILNHSLVMLIGKALYLGKECISKLFFCNIPFNYIKERKECCDCSEKSA